MPLPDLIEIIPPSAPVTAEVPVPGSKSITNRALILAAFSHGRTTLKGALWSEDTQVMVAGLRQMGFAIDVAPDGSDDGNRVIRIQGEGGRIPNAGRPGSPLELFVGNAGTAARFLAAMTCLGRGTYRLSGVARMNQRPQAELFTALRSLGYNLESANDRLPVTIHGEGPRPGTCEVSVRDSSQFASALLLSAQHGQWDVRVRDGNEEELPYVEMTKRLIEAFPSAGGEFQIEPDASSGSYFWAAGWLLGGRERTGPGVAVRHWPASGWQIDEAYPRFLPPGGEISRQRDLGDSIMTAIVMAPFASEPCRFTDLGRLRLQECERVFALRTELTRCGATIVEQGDTIEVQPSTLHGAEIETYGDHRMAMCFAVVGLKVPGIRLRDPGCVRKTFPHFFARLAAPPPAGLGVQLLDARTRSSLSGADLLADESAE